MKNLFSSVQNKMIKKYALDDEGITKAKSTDINVLLNRVKLDQKKEKIRKLIFTAATSLGVVLFGVLIFWYLLPFFTI